ncbi:MAG: RICIN domain-containing protein, partial [Prevotellaceae bacterium]|nr:RICIN domain-containing protein [Prevotellaceae bacterium]
MKRLLPILLLMLGAQAQAQVTSCASSLRAVGKADVSVPFRYDDEGKQTPLEWGLDLAWLSEDNVRTGVFYVGKDMIDVVRTSFQPTASVSSGEFSDDQKTDLDSRISIMKSWLGTDVGYYLNDDNPTENSDYSITWSTGSNKISSKASSWAALIDMTADYYKENGLENLVAIAPLNEPDNYSSTFGISSIFKSSVQGKVHDLFKDISKLFKEDDSYKEKYANVRLCGGNTLNTDSAYFWWNYCSPYLDEGNTHQLAGTFDNYASFFETLTSEGAHATNDELHNVMECMVGAEYGMQTGIWWGTNENVRSQFMKATAHANPGDRLAYAEHRDNWTAASVYRQPTGEVQAFGGMSERQSYTTDYRFVCNDRPVWYDGVRGHEYLMHLIGGTGYQEGQTEAEVMVNVQSGTDVMPSVGEGVYKIMNVNSGKLLGFGASPSQTAWVSATQRNNSTASYVQWVLTPLTGEDVWGDQSYYSLTVNTGSNLYLDILNWNYEDGTDVGSYPGDLGTIEQWYLEYAGDGAFYIRSRYNAKCLEVSGSNTAVGGNVQMGSFTGGKNQQWRFLDTSATPDLEAPDAPSNLKATPRRAGVKLRWKASQSDDVKEYCIVRNGCLLARGIEGCSFTDNEADPDSTYAYYVFALDNSLNKSEASNTVEDVQVTDEEGKVMRLALSDSLMDRTVNGNHCAVYGDVTYLSEDTERGGISLSGSDNFIQLPYTIANHDALTVACWVKAGSTDTWQRVFDFGNDTDQYLFLTTNSGSNPRFAIKNGGEEQTVDGKSEIDTDKWHHLAVTLGDGTACLYVDGVLDGENDKLTISPSDIRPLFNYIGRSQYNDDPYLTASVSDFTVLNYVLTADEIKELMDTDTEADEDLLAQEAEEEANEEEVETPDDSEEEEEVETPDDSEGEEEVETPDDSEEEEEEEEGDLNTDDNNKGNDTEVGVKDVGTDTKEEVIYDLNGRRV